MECGFQGESQATFDVLIDHERITICLPLATSCRFLNSFTSSNLQLQQTNSQFHLSDASNLKRVSYALLVFCVIAAPYAIKLATPDCAHLLQSFLKESLFYCPFMKSTRLIIGCKSFKSALTFAVAITINAVKMQDGLF